MGCALVKEQGSEGNGLTGELLKGQCWCLDHFVVILMRQIVGGQ